MLYILLKNSRSPVCAFTFVDLYMRSSVLWAHHQAATRKPTFQSNSARRPF